MYTNQELENIYDKRYSVKESGVNKREMLIYNKFRSMLLPEIFLTNEISNLDVGCGRGHKTVGFTKGFKRVLAVDLSKNVIEHCERFYRCLDHIEFKVADAMHIEERFNLITAFGFSLFNRTDNDAFLRNVNSLSEKNLVQGARAFFIVGSFTDFTGTGEDSWYMHTREDLRYLKEQLEKKNVKVQIIFPYKRYSNYIGKGFYNFFAECYKLVAKRRKFFFIVIEHG